MNDTIMRQWKMLQHIPREPRTITSVDLTNRLRLDGYDVTLRTVQRDLNTLSTLFSLRNRVEEGKNGWFWAKDAPPLTVPGLDTNTALAFVVVEEHARALLPPSTVQYLEPYFELAASALENGPASKLIKWKDKVRVVPQGQALIPPDVDKTVADTILTALLNDHRIRASYRKRDALTAKEYDLAPVGFVVRHNAAYLVAYSGDKTTPQQFALHRFESARDAAVPFRPPADFSLERYIIDGNFDYPNSTNSLALRAAFDGRVAVHLAESKVSDDQTVEALDDGRLLVMATVKDTQQLRWWLLSFGASVEVLGPSALRQEFFEIAEEMRARYGR